MIWVYYSGGALLYYIVLLGAGIAMVTLETIRKFFENKKSKISEEH